MEIFCKLDYSPKRHSLGKWAIKFNEIITCRLLIRLECRYNLLRQFASSFSIVLKRHAFISLTTFAVKYSVRQRLRIVIQLNRNFCLFTLSQRHSSSTIQLLEFLWSDSITQWNKFFTFFHTKTVDRTFYFQNIVARWAFFETYSWL